MQAETGAFNDSWTQAVPALTIAHHAQPMVPSVSLMMDRSENPVFKPVQEGV
jgi:hypothetical protein